MTTATPTVQSRSLVSAVGLLEGRELLEDEPLCLNLRGRMMHCEHCARACHSGALALSADALEVDREKCTGCGGCVPACPAGALHLTGFSPGRFLEALRGEAEVHLHCTASEDSGGGVVIPCYKVLDARLLAAARAEGVEIVHLHGLNSCHGCRHGGALKAVARIRLRLRHWLGASAPVLRPADAANAAGERRREDQPHLSRRAFLRFAGSGVVDGAARWLVPMDDADAIDDLPFFQGDLEEVRRPHPYQSVVAQRVTEIPWAVESVLPWRTRSLAEHCTACLTCGRRCPTGALQARDEGQSLEVSFEPARCTDCGLCETLCPVHAVDTRSARTPKEVLAPRSVLMMRRQRICGQCGHPFLPQTAGEEDCAVCRNEKELDEEWLAMLQG